jgi:hypothetical protein
VHGKKGVKMLDFLNPRVLRQVSMSHLAVRGEPSDEVSLETELLAGDLVEVYSETGSGWSSVRSCRDGYQGYVRNKGISREISHQTHRIAAPRTIALAKPVVQTPNGIDLWMNCRVTCTGRTEGIFVEVHKYGWVPKHHLVPIGMLEDEPVSVALQFLGTPYVWGGSKSAGIDCSGLIQQAFLACGVSMPRNASEQEVWQGIHDQQIQEIGRGELSRNDLVFWRGHVAIMLDNSDMVSATDYRDVSIEKLSQVCEERRGPPTAYRRIMRGAE